MGSTRLWIWGLAAAMSVAGCGKWADRLACGDQGCEFTRDEWSRVQSLANVTARPVPPDPSNKYLPIADPSDGTLKTDAATMDPVVQLGWQLYYEPLLSGSVSNVDSMGALAPTTREAPCGQVQLSCASCHDPQHAGSDVTSQPRHVSIGAGWYDVNAQQTLNVARFPVLYWNGRTDTLWAQAAQVMESPVSMNGYRMKTFWLVVNRYLAAYEAAGFTDPSVDDIKALAALLGSAPSLTTAPIQEFRTQYAQYKMMLKTLMLSDDEPTVVTRVHVNVAKAIAAYEWLLSSDGSEFDKFAMEGIDSNALQPAARRGLKLFIGRAGCIDCHNTPMFSDGKFHNIGIAQTGTHVPTTEACTKKPCDCSSETDFSTCLPSGAFGGHQKLVAFHQGNDFDGVMTPPQPAPTPAAEPDMDMRLMGAWRTPSLRDVARTAPYMHDGSLATLSDVVWHYAEAQGTGGLGQSELAPLTLDTQDRDDLVAFLQSLNGVAGPPELIGPPPSPDAGTGSIAAPSCSSPDGGLPDAP
jgi:cytochrome c peroxidase